MINIIAAIQRKDRGIGFKNELVFRISDDLKRFKSLTTGHPMIMGRKTFDSFGGRMLPNRTHIVISRSEGVEKPDLIYTSSLEEALGEAQILDQEVFIIGGGEIYAQALPYTKRLYLTIANSDKPADVFFPDHSGFNEVISEENHTDEKTGLEYSYVTLEK